MKKIYKRLTEQDKKDGVIFTSTLSTERTEQEDDVMHKVYKTDDNATETIDRLKNDSFFNNSPFKYNIIRR